jgi:hypothetical protein
MSAASKAIQAKLLLELLEIPVVGHYYASLLLDSIKFTSSFTTNLLSSTIDSWLTMVAKHAVPKIWRHRRRMSAASTACQLVKHVSMSAASKHVTTGDTGKLQVKASYTSSRRPNTLVAKGLMH